MLSLSKCSTRTGGTEASAGYTWQQKPRKYTTHFSRSVVPPLTFLPRVCFLRNACACSTQPWQQIFRPGCKLVLGSGASVGQEGRFVTAVVGAIEAGGGEPGRPEAVDAGGGGYVVLEMPVKLDHAEGTRVVNGRPGRVEAAAYRKRQARGLQVFEQASARVVPN